MYAWPQWKGQMTPQLETVQYSVFGEAIVCTFYVANIEKDNPVPPHPEGSWNRSHTEQWPTSVSYVAEYQPTWDRWYWKNTE